MFLKLLGVLMLISTVSTRIAPKVESIESDEKYSSTPLTYKNYGTVLHDNPLVLLKFFTNWCYFSQQMFEAWENLGDFYFEDDRIMIAEIDCEPLLNKQVCRGFGVDAYPTILVFKDGVKVEKYLGERNKADLVEYANQMIKKNVVIKDET